MWNLNGFPLIDGWRVLFFFTHTTLEFLNTAWSNWEIASVTRGRCRVLLCFPSLYLCCVQIFFIFHRQHRLKTTLLYNVPDFTSSSHSINPITTQRSVYTFKLLFLVPQIPFSALPYRFGFIGSSDVSHFSHENIFIRVSTDCVPGPVAVGVWAVIYLRQTRQVKNDPAMRWYSLLSRILRPLAWFLEVTFKHWF